MHLSPTFQKISPAFVIEFDELAKEIDQGMKI
jgi:hypothetical protein